MFLRASEETSRVHTPHGGYIRERKINNDIFFDINKIQLKLYKKNQANVFSSQFFPYIRVKQLLELNVGQDLILSIGN